MIDFIKSPNIPTKKVQSIIIDYRTNPLAVNTLKKLGITVYNTQRTDNLYDAVAGHPDMVCFHAGGNRFIVSPENVSFYQKIPQIDVISGVNHLTDQYPYDIAYNAARVGKYLIHNFKYTDKMILKYSENLEKINVAQGYAKCSVCVISHNAIITSDMGIAKKCDNFGIDVLFVDNKQIKLPGVSHGLFGGIGGLISPNRLAVNGDIYSHRNFEEILSFCKKYAVEILPLHNGALEDIGSIIPITENA